MSTEKSSSNLVAQAKSLIDTCHAIRREISQVVVGQESAIEQLLIAMLARGHCLLQGVPGLAKTLMIRALAESIECKFQRIQFTPDLMPADITGTEIIQENSDTGRRELKFEPGPIFTQILLADEINRTPPKTQAALLEAMQEHSVTLGGQTYSLTEPFFVLATQNPIEQEGTYPLPEAQRDRFLFQVNIDYPSREEEFTIIDRTTSTDSPQARSVTNGETFAGFQKLVRQVPLPDNAKAAVVDLVRSIRPSDSECRRWAKELLDWGPGPRASQQLVMASKSRALLHGRYHVTREDVEALALPVLRHRIVPSFVAKAEGLTADDLIRRALGRK